MTTQHVRITLMHLQTLLTDLPSILHVGTFIKIFLIYF